MTTYIYVLIDPRDGRPRYVGKSRDPKRRLQDHCYRRESNGRRLPIHRWVEKLKTQFNRRPTMVILEECGDDWERRECRWIAYFRRRYDDLLNISSGGGAGDYERTPETRAKLAASLRGRKGPEKSPATRLRISEALRGKPKPNLSDEHKAKLRAVLDAHRHKPRRQRITPLDREMRRAFFARPDVKAKCDDAKCREYIVTFPDGHEERVRGLQRFAKAHGLDSGSLNKVANGAQGRKRHRGFRARPA